MLCLQPWLSCTFNGQLEETAFNNREEWIVPNSVVQVGTNGDTGEPIYEPNTTPLTMYGPGTVKTSTGPDSG